MQSCIHYAETSRIKTDNHHVKINKDGILLIPGHISSSIGRLKYT